MDITLVLTDDEYVEIIQYMADFHPRKRMKAKLTRQNNGTLYVMFKGSVSGCEIVRTYYDARRAGFNNCIRQIQKIAKDGIPTHTKEKTNV